MTEAKRDASGIASAIVLIVMGALTIYYAQDFTSLGRVFPVTIATLMIVLSAVYLVVSIVHPQPSPVPERGSPARRILLVVAMVAWALLLQPLGFLTASIIGYAAVLLVGHYDRWTPRMAVIYASIGIAVVGGLYALFAFVFEVPFPKGLAL